jgi:membrane associated rhomboid family serine protease
VVAAREYLTYLPITVGVFAVVSWALVVSDVSQFQLGFVPSRRDPVEMMSSMLFHEGMGHYRGNMLYAFVPFGVVLTLLTGNRHVLGVILVSHGVPALGLGLIGWLGVGSSIAAFGILSATLVRSVGLGMQNESDATFQMTALGLLAPFVSTLFVLVLFNVPAGINHTAHFLGFLCGAGYEYVFVARERNDADRTESRR